MTERKTPTPEELGASEENRAEEQEAEKKERREEEKKPSIYEIIKKAEFAENAELITVEVEGLKEKPVLLRVKEMPEFAFLLEPEMRACTDETLAFRLPREQDEKYVYKGYGVISAARLPGKEEGVEVKKFKQSVVDACRAHGVKAIFMDDAEWDTNYGENLKIFNAANHQEAMEALYDRKVIRRALRLIDYGNSSLLRDPLGVGAVTNLID